MYRISSNLKQKDFLTKMFLVVKLLEILEVKIKVTINWNCRIYEKHKTKRFIGKKNQKRDTNESLNILHACTEIVLDFFKSEIFR